MSSPVTLHFPDAGTMTAYLSNHPLLTKGYYQEKGVTTTIVELAAARFANSEKSEGGVKIGAASLIIDLQTGKDGFSGEPLLNLRKFDWLPPAWQVLEQQIEKALIDCAHSAQVN